VAGDHAPVLEDDTGLPRGAPDGQVAGLLAEGDDLQDLE
jgi:hypothetical protein